MTHRLIAMLLGAVALLSAAVCGLGAALATGPGAAVYGQSQRLTEVKVSVPVTSLTEMELYTALGKGVFTRKGLKVDIVAFHGGGPDAAALINGNVQFNLTPDSYYVSLLAQGKKALNVLNIQNKSIITWAMRRQTAARLGITPATPLDEKLKALKGVKIGITTPGALTDQLARYYAQRGGLNPARDVQIIPVGSGSEGLAALQNGKVDVIVVSVPQPELAVQRGIAVEFMGVGEDPELRDFLMNSVHVMPNYAQAHADTVRRFVQAILEAMRWEQGATPAQIAAVVQPYLKGYHPDLLVAGVRQVKKALNPTGRVTRAAAEETLRVLGERRVTADQLYAEFDAAFLR